MIKNIAKFVGFWWTGFVLIMYLLDSIWFGIIPHQTFLLPFEVVAIGALLYLVWKSKGKKVTDQE